MQARIFCKTGSLAGLEHSLGVETTLGKSSANDVVLNTHIVSRNHARIFFDNQKNRYFLQDRDSRNGTSLDGAKLGKDPVELGDLHVITFAGKVDLIFQVMKEGASSPTKPAAPAQPAVQSQQQSPQKPAIEKTFEEDAGMKTVADSGGFVLPAGLERAGSQQQQSQQDSETERESEEDAGMKTVADSGGFVLPAGLEGTDSPEGSSEEGTADTGADLSRTVADSGGFVAPPIPGIGAGATEETSGIASFKLIASDGSQSFDLSEGVSVIGSSADCHITLSDESISEKHASLTLVNGKLILKILGEGWTSVNASQVSIEREVKEGDIIRIGIIQLKITKN
ncbi:MAG: FHA domain-containing protein [candidate division Zixibacteria bacterium]|nr:FHA domain-containing protein [candidate division Zixibacteria bacterium]